MAAPKPKYIEPILIGTHNREDFRTIVDALSDRLGDTSWSIVFKSLIVLHIMIREGEEDVTLKYLSKHSRYLELPQIKTIRSGDTKSLLRYARYLSVKAKQFGSTGIDYVRNEQSSNKEGARLRDLPIEKGLLREVESVEKQISALLGCKFNEVDINNDVVLTCFRMLVNDLLCLFQALNEGVINILEHYFEMSKYDAETALEIYKDFVVLTTDVVNYLRVAKHLEYATKLHVPTIKHAPTALAKSLEEYLHDEQFEINRSQYLAEKDFKSKSPIKPTKQDDNNPWSNQIQPLQIQFTQAQPVQMQPTVQPVQSMVQPMVQQIVQPVQPIVQPVQPVQRIVQPVIPVQLQPQPTNNPFLQAPPVAQLQPVQQQTFPVQQTFTGVQQSFTGVQQPFTGMNGNGVQSLAPQQTLNPFLQQQVQKPLESSKTGNNPFALDYKSNPSNPFSQANVKPQSTGNPFQQQQQQAAAASNRFTFGGYENLPTTPVFPETIHEQKTNQFNQNAQLQLQQQIDSNKQQQFFQQQQQLQQQFTTNGYLNNQFTGFQQPQQQQQQPAYQGYQNNYDGPSLI